MKCFRDNCEEDIAVHTFFIYEEHFDVSSFININNMNECLD